MAIDEKRAARMFRLAAERGNPVAQNRLARLYANGVAVGPADPVQAAKWHLLARESGVADFTLDVMLAKLTPEQRAKKPPVSQPIPAARPSSVLVAMLGDAKSPVAAVYDPATGALRVAAGPGVPDARVAQLWVIGGDGVPHSLGLLAARPTVLAPRGADRGRIAPGATLAISIEPLGGSPTGLPTGPVVATGVVARV